MDTVMTKINFKDLELGMVYYIKPFIFTEFGKPVGVEEGIYEVVKKYDNMESAPSPTVDMGGYEAVLSVAVYKQVNYVILKNVFSGVESIIDNRVAGDIAHEFYVSNKEIRAAMYGQYRTNFIKRRVKNKETAYVVMGTLDDDVASLGTIIDCIYSPTMNHIIFMLVDSYNGKLKSFKESVIRFPDLEKEDEEFKNMLDKKEETE